MTTYRRLNPEPGPIPYRDEWAPILCRRCHQPITRGPQGGWGHVVNPRQHHHYPIPERAS